MKLKLVAFAIAAVVNSASAQANSEYVCKVYCNNGSTYATVTASSTNDAASLADRSCQDAGKGNASSTTMESSQCSKK